MIEAKHIKKQVKTEEQTLTILEDVSLFVQAQQTVAILGASGCGKSTFLAILAGLDNPTKGEVYLDQVLLNELSQDQKALLRAKLLGFIFQDFQLIASFTALENVMLPLELVGNKAAKEQASYWLEQVGLSHRLKHYPKQLSGGEQQRVAIARSFINQPKILLADEPTGNLDQATGHKMIELLFELNQTQATTLVLVTHDQALAQQCQQRYRLEHGTLQIQDD